LGGDIPGSEEKKFAEPDEIALRGIHFLKTIEETVFRLPE